MTVDAVACIAPCPSVIATKRRAPHTAAAALQPQLRSEQVAVAPTVRMAVRELPRFVARPRDRPQLRLEAGRHRRTSSASRDRRGGRQRTHILRRFPATSQPAAMSEIRYRESSCAGIVRIAMDSGCQNSAYHP